MAKLFDSSAVLAYLQGETGAERVRQELPDGMISSINAAEVMTVMARHSIPISAAEAALRQTQLQVLEFNWRQAAVTAGLLSSSLRNRGISLADAACMATAIGLQIPVLTADRAWSKLNIAGLRVIAIR